jgi:hypothetical protein
VQSIYERIDGRDRSSGQRFELNLYIVGDDEESSPPELLVAGVVADGGARAAEPPGVPAAEGEQPAEPTSPEGSTSA